MAVVSIDGTDIEAIVSDAQTIPGQPVPRGTKVEAKPEEPKETKEEAKAETKEASKDTKEDPEDVQDDEGLTPREKRELTEKMQRAIAKRTRALRDAEEFATEQYNERRMAEQRAESFQREINRLKAELQPKELVKDEKPVRENFKTDEEFRDALDDYRVDLKFKEREAKAEKERQEARQREVIAEASARISKAIELVPDYKEVTEGADIEVPPYIAGYMQESEMFAELGYHFAKHPNDLERLRSFSPAKALVEVGKIESMLKPFSAQTEKVSNGEDKSPSQNGAKPPQAQPSIERVETRAKPPAPIRPLTQGSAVQVDKPEAEMTAAEAMAAWQRKRHVNLNKRQRH